MPRPALDSRVRPNENVLFQELNGDAVLLNIKSGTYFGLNPVGRRVWQLLETRDTIAGLRDAIVQEFDVSEAQCDADLVALVADMAAHGLVTVS